MIEVERKIQKEIKIQRKIRKIGFSKQRENQ